MAAPTQAHLGNPKHWPGLVLMAVSFFAYVYLPIAILILLSFNENEQATIWTGFSLDWYARALANNDMISAAKNSLIIATIAAIGSTSVATLAATRMTFDRFRGQMAVGTLIALPLTLPEIVTAVATLMLFSLIGLPLGLTSVILAHTVFCIPFAYLPIKAQLDRFDPKMMEAAEDLYSRPLQTFFYVTLPLLAPGIMSGAVLAFIISLDDFVTTFFVGGAGSTTLPIYIFGLIRVGVSPEVNAISTLMLVVSIIMVSLSLLLSRGQGQPSD